MNKIILILSFVCACFPLFSQEKTAEDFGFKHLKLKYKTDMVDILIKSKKGEENVKKPLFFFCQGSLPQPLIKYDDRGAYSVFPFNPDSLLEKYHLVIVGKPCIPVIYEDNKLTNHNYLDKNGLFPKEFTDRDLLSYYVGRNIAVIKFLQKQNWISSEKLVVAGHSQGSTIAAKMAEKYRKITHLIYSSGNPFGRTIGIIEEARSRETDSLQLAEQEFEHWQYVVENKINTDNSQGDTPKTTYEFSIPPINYLEKLKIPVLVNYGTKDWCSPYVDLMRVIFIEKGKKNFQFDTYIDTEHNFFPLNADGSSNYDVFNWDKVADNWLKWLK